MNKYNTIFYKMLSYITKVISSVAFGKEKTVLSPNDRYIVKTILKSEPVIILTASKVHLSSFLVKVLSYFTTFKKTEYSHAVMSYYDYKDDTFILIESTNSGVHVSSFDEVMACSDICILEIKHDHEKDIDLINNELQKQLGKKYDNLFDIADESRVSCVEVVYHSLKKFDFDKDYPNLAKTIAEKNTLTPQMFRDCGDFKILFEK